MKRYVSPNSSCSSSSRFSTCAWIETSSADTGSSHTMSFGLQRERARDADALPLAARELVRVAVDVLGVEPDDVEQLLGTRLCCSRPCPDAVDHERLGDDLADGHARVQARIRVLEDDLDVAAERLELRPLRAQHVAAVERDSTRPSARSAA